MTTQVITVEIRVKLDDPEMLEVECFSFPPHKKYRKALAFPGTDAGDLFWEIKKYGHWELGVTLREGP